MLSRPAAAVLFWLLAMFCTRLQLCLHWGEPLSKHWGDGWLPGFCQDLSALAFGLAIAGLASAITRKLRFARAVWGVAFLFWATSLANALYFSFFTTTLEWWVIVHHTGDVAQVASAIARLLFTAPLLASVCAMLISTVLAFQLPSTLQRAWSVGCTIIFLVAALLLKQSPVWFDIFSIDMVTKATRGTLLAQLPVYLWIDQAVLESGQSRDHLTAESIRTASNVLAQYQDFFSKRPEQRLNASFPLVRRLTWSSESSRKLREEMALPENGPIHVVIVFMESFRAFEVYHPMLGPHAAPYLNELRQRKSLSFDQVYSSSVDAGQTTRGMYSLLCSTLTNARAPAVYMAHPYLSVFCLGELFRDHQYSTVSIQSGTANYHGTRMFDISHGVDTALSGSDFEPMEKVTFGYADKPFLAAAADRLIQLQSKSEKPLFATVNTISTHFPHRYMEPNTLPPELVTEASRSRQSIAYLSTLNYSDDALKQFATKLFASAIGDRTLVVFVADHSIHNVQSHLPTTREQQIEIGVRIPLILTTKNMNHARRISEPMHQMDVAPLIAQIMGFSVEGPWLGSGPFGLSRGRPWTGFVDEAEHASYRTRERACYTLAGSTSAQCKDVTGNRDPLFDGTLPNVKELPEEADFFTAVLKSDRILVRANHFMPPRRR